MVFSHETGKRGPLKGQFMTYLYRIVSRVILWARFSQCQMPPHANEANDTIAGSIGE
jgi:hypothetical protein